MVDCDNKFLLDLVLDASDGDAATGACSLVAVLALYTADLAGVTPYGACKAALRSADRSKWKRYSASRPQTMLNVCSAYTSAPAFERIVPPCRKS